MLSLEDIRQLCSGRVALEEPLAHMTTFRVGGPADIYVEPQNTGEVIALVGYFKRHNIPSIVLGNGSNVLIADEGYRGACISLEAGFSFIDLEEDAIRAGAGVRLATFVDFCISHGWGGTEMLAGIPGTLGGAIIMNAGAYGGEISDYLLDVTLLREGESTILPQELCGFRYRNSDLKRDIVLEARFTLPKGNMQELKERRKELLVRRNAAQPTRFPNAGSIFKNPQGMFAAKLIEECGLKGHRIGGAEVSPLHANFIVTDRNATAREILDLINHVRKTVFARKGVELEPEILLIGFAADALEPVQMNPTNEVER